MLKLKHSLSAAMLLCAAGFATAQIASAATSPVAHWTFDDDSILRLDAALAGTDADANAAPKPAAIVKDAVTGNKFAAVSSASLKSVPGVSGAALDLSAASQSPLSVPAAVLPANIRELTFAAWIAPRALNGNPAIFLKDDGEQRLIFGFRSDGKFLTLGLNCGANYAELHAPVAPEELLDNRWHHIAATFSDGDKTMRVFLDGTEIGTYKRQVRLNTAYDFVQGWHPATESAPGVPLTIGGGNAKDSAFEGKLDDVRFYSQALTAEEIRSLVTAINPAAAAPVPLDSSAKQSLEDDLLRQDNAVEIAALRASPQKRIAAHRALQRKYPDAVNAYVMKWKKSPVEVLLLDQDARRARVAQLAENAFEYLPLTDFQWAALNATERTDWQKVKVLKEKLSDTKQPVSVTEILALETLYQERPATRERVATYQKPATPATRDRTAAEARAVLERDWLFQCDNRPTAKRILQEIEWARQIAERIALPKDSPLLASLASLETEAKALKPNAQDKKSYFAVREIKRQIIFKNPVLDFDSILYIDNPYPSGREWQHETRHRLGYMAGTGGRLIVQKGLGPDAHFTKIAPAEPLHGSFWRPDLSFDATKILFSFKPHNEKTFHLYEIGIDGAGLRQLSGGIFDDFDPIYLPDGKNILFTTTRGYLYVRCMPPTNAMVTAKMPLDTKPGDSKKLYIISRNGEPEYTPSIMDDGRILFTRWEYTDKPLWRAQKLWTMSQNGELVQTFWGNQSVWPDLMKDARLIPGSKRVMFTGSAHHNWFAGSVGIIDPAKGLNFPHGLTKVTQEVQWPECGDGPVDPKENDTYHVAGKYRAYYSPYPLSEKEFLVSASRDGKFVLLFMDTDGNREIINEGEYNIFDAMPVRKRKVPPAHPDKLAWPTWEERNNPAVGTIYSNNVYEGAPEELKGKAKYLRIWSIEHKTYTYWNKRPHLSTGPEISAVQSEGVKKIIGTVPIEDDGSVNFSAPSGIALHFQLLDKEQNALQTMKSFTGVQPGEVRGCFGCHEQHMGATQGPIIGKAMRRKPSSITPVPWEDITVSFERYVQPALDEYCGKCHTAAGTKAQKAFNSKLRPGFLGFKEPYMTLLGNPTWGRPYREPKQKSAAFGWADTILIESYSKVDPKAYITYPPMKKLSYASRLVKRFAGQKIYPTDKHPRVETDEESLLRVKLWVDAMGPFSGAEELRQQEDPLFHGKDWLSQPPRIHTAPIVQRPGPFDAFDTVNDPAYATPAPSQYNKLPAGVKR